MPLPFALVVVSGINLEGTERFENAHLLALADVFLQSSGYRFAFGLMASSAKRLLDEFVI